jgi:endogenous inhibitor of DNA gyrase (YacG/DUF329 family)
MSTRISGTSRITGTLTSGVSRGSRVRSYATGRTCGHGECDTILSVYNPAKYCAVHAGLAIGRKRSMPRPVTEVVCARCGVTFETANPARKFCSDRCRMAAFARRKRAAVRAERRLQQEQQAPQAVARSAAQRTTAVDAA